MTTNNNASIYKARKQRILCGFFVDSSNSALSTTKLIIDCASLSLEKIPLYLLAVENVDFTTLFLNLSKIQRFEQYMGSLVVQVDH